MCPLRTGSPGRQFCRSLHNGKPQREQREAAVPTGQPAQAFSSSMTPKRISVTEGYQEMAQGGAVLVEFFSHARLCTVLGKVTKKCPEWCAATGQSERVQGL